MSLRLAKLGVLCVITSAVLTSASCRTTTAQEATALQQVSFRLVTDIFTGNQTAPTQQTRTLFSRGVAYDISLNDPNQITMVDPLRGRIVLLNKASQQKTEIDVRQLNEFIDAARKQAEASDLATYLQGAAKIDVSSDGVSVGDSVLLYKATLQHPREPQMAEMYAQVADALALLNGWRSGVPPFARLSLNRAIAEAKALPEEITRTTTLGRQTSVVRCLLHTNWRLSKDDEEQIADIGKMLVNYTSVAPTEFFAPAGKVAAGSRPQPQ